MKKKLLTPTIIIVIITGYLSLSAITASAQTTVHHTVAKKVYTKKPTAAQLAEGKALFLKSDCLTCHKLDVKLVGPAYYDVAKKYPPTQANYELLANKVISGGSGVWGTVAMAPHTALTHDDAMKIVKYILSLKPGQS